MKTKANETNKISKANGQNFDWNSRVRHQWIYSSRSPASSVRFYYASCSHFAHSRRVIVGRRFRFAQTGNHSPNSNCLSACTRSHARLRTFVEVSMRFYIFIFSNLFKIFYEQTERSTRKKQATSGISQFTLLLSTPTKFLTSWETKYNLVY